jgi:hypothetical protein
MGPDGIAAAQAKIQILMQKINELASADMVDEEEEEGKEKEEEKEEDEEQEVDPDVLICSSEARTDVAAALATDLHLPFIKFRLFFAEGEYQVLLARHMRSLSSARNNPFDICILHF